jgi:hypothetical protein
VPSSPGIYFEAGYFEDGYFEPLVIVPEIPAVIDIGEPGNPLHALPFRAAGGSVADLDLLYGVLGRDPQAQDIQPIFILGTRTGIYRAYGLEVPRQGILDTVVEGFATLIEVGDSVVEGNPAGPNLFSPISLTTRPTMTVVLNNSDGSITDLSERELLMGCPAGLLWDVNHTVIVPELVGTVSAVDDGIEATITFGMSARPPRAPNITD